MIYVIICTSMYYIRVLHTCTTYVYYIHTVHVLHACTTSFCMELFININYEITMAHNLFIVFSYYSLLPSIKAPVFGKSFLVLHAASNLIWRHHHFPSGWFSAQISQFTLVSSCFSGAASLVSWSNFLQVVSGSHLLTGQAVAAHSLEALESALVTAHCPVVKQELFPPKDKQPNSLRFAERDAFKPQRKEQIKQKLQINTQMMNQNEFFFDKANVDQCRRFRPRPTQTYWSHDLSEQHTRKSVETHLTSKLPVPFQTACPLWSSSWLRIHQAVAVNLSICSSTLTTSNRI